MKTFIGVMKQLAKLGFILMIGISMSACSDSWKEEVQLHDGRKIIVDRVQNRGGYPALESRERVLLDETITFSLPGSNEKITWSMSFRDDNSEQNGVNVFVMDIVNNTPYIAGYPAGCIAYNKWNRPNPPQILYKYEGRQWKRITKEEFPSQISNANLIVGGPVAEGIKSFYTVAQVNEKNRYIKTPEYHIVLREPMNRGIDGSSINCVELVRVEGGWISPGGGKSPVLIGAGKTNDVKK